MKTYYPYLPTANTSEIRSRLYRGAIQLGYSLTGIQFDAKTPGQRRARQLTLKIVVLGDAGTGKSSLIARYLENRDLQLQHLPTVYGEYYTRRLFLGDRRVSVQVWDVPQHILESDINDECFLQRSHGAILVYDVTNKSSYDSVEKYLRKIRRYAYPGAMCLLLGNKKDLQPATASSSPQQSLSTIGKVASYELLTSSGGWNKNKEITYEEFVSSNEARQFAEGYSMEFIEASAYTGTNVQEAFNSMLTALNEVATNYYSKIEFSSGSATSNA